MDSQARQLPRYVFEAVASPAEYLICSNSETAFWLLTSIITLTNVTYLVRAKAGIESGHKQAATRILPPSSITGAQDLPPSLFLKGKAKELKYPNRLAGIGILLGAQSRLVSTEWMHYGCLSLYIWPSLPWSGQS